MTDETQPEKLSKEELAKVQGGITLDNGIKRGSNITLDNGIKQTGVWAPDRDGGSVLSENAGADGVIVTGPDLKKKT